MKTIISLLFFFFVAILLKSTESTMYMKRGQHLELGNIFIKKNISKFFNYFNHLYIIS